MNLSDIDLLDRDVFAEGIPHEWFTFLRQEAPVYRHPAPDDSGFWVVTKHADVVTVGRDAATYSSDQSRGGVIGLDGDVVNDPELEAGKLMLMTDAPAHTRYRKLVNHGFTPRRVDALEPHVRDMASRIVDDMLAKGSCDFVVDVAAELPLQVIAELLGVSQEDRHKLFDWSNRMVGSEDPEYAVTEENVNEARIEMFMYAQALADERRQNPRDDIVTALLGAEVDGDRLSDLDFNLFFMLLSVAGNETTRNSIAHGMRAFLEHPDQWQALVDDPTLIGTATDEIVRWASPVMYFRRNCTRATELRGQAIAAGDVVSIWYVSANRDEDVFDDPFRFDIRRNPNPHVGFGGGGPHFCLGASLARMEIRALFDELARRVPDIRLAGDVVPLRSNFIGGIKHMPVEYGAA